MKKIPRGEYRISITSCCNMKCVYCHNEGQTTLCQLALSDIDTLLANSYDIGLKSVRLTGGEPLIHPQIIDICRLIKDKYKLKVGINTNMVKYDVLVELINNKLVDRLVIGMDYFDGKISKNSPCGVSSQLIKKQILEINDKLDDIAIDMVYNHNEIDIDKMMEFCLNNKIEIKVLENISNFSDEYHEDFMKLINRLSEKYGIMLITSKEEFDQYRGVKDGIRVASFFNSICREKKCKLCKKMHLRISADGILHHCAINCEGICFKNGNVRKNILDSLSQ